MRSSSFCPEFRRARLFGLALLVCAARPSLALDPQRSVSQYVRQQWSVDRGFPKGPVYSIGQTKDGYLWIGTENGLIRFDGLNFRRMEFSSPDLPELSNVLGVIAGEDGGLWARLRRPALLRLRDGVFESVMGREGRPEGSVSAMARAVNGGLLTWVLQGEPAAMVLRGGKFETIASPVNFSRSPVLAIAQTANGDVWVGTRDAGLFRLRGTDAVAIREGLPDLKVNALAAAGDRLWVGTDGGIAYWDGAKLSKSDVPVEVNGVQTLALAMDRDGNLWAGTNSRGLVRINRNGAAFWESTGSETYAVTALFEDREGNIWAGRGNGLEQLRDSAFVTYSPAEGLPSDGSTPVHVDDLGRAWFAPASGGLWWFQDGKHGQVAAAGLDRDIVYSIANDGGRLWVGRQHGGLTSLAWNGSTIQAGTFTRADGLAQNSVYSVYRSRDGGIWAGTLSGGVTRISGGKLITYTTAAGLPSNTVATMLETRDGAMWFGTPGGLSALAGTQWRTFTVKDGLLSDDINCLLEDSKGTLWIGTSAGLSWRGSEKIHAVPKLAGALREQILGIAEDQAGWLWIASATHVLRVNRDALAGGFLTADGVREYGIADGLRGVEGVKRHQSVIADASGRIWFSMNRGISVIDPRRLGANPVEAIADVQTVSADGKSFPLLPAPRIPGGPGRIVFGFTGLSFSIPDRVRFRYRLDGFDQSWSEPTTAREAAYTNLPPRSYRFRVVASNPDGVWSTEESVVTLDVAPLLWQTAWFRAGSAGSLVLAVILIYRLRLSQMTRRLNVRFEERLTERTRIAQELHDTLLQGFVSVSMQVHVASDLVPEESRAAPLLNRSLQLMTQVIDEGRNAVRGLRSSTSTSLDLEAAFSRIGEEIEPRTPGGAPVTFRVIVEGKPRPLHPLLRDDLYRIGREALVNAFRHAQASHVELVLQYSHKLLRLFVRDDGCGIDPEVLRRGRDGHWGLPGMRERADRIGARFRIWSKAGKGTEVELSVPGRTAFTDHRTMAPFWGRRSQSKSVDNGVHS